MKVAVLFGLLVSLALASACGGQVLVDGDGDAGGGGATGGGPGQGGAGSCVEIECSDQGSSCDCQTTCLGPDLHADCELQPTGEIMCECHYDDAYLGTCFAPSGSVCGLPGGCCYAYLP